MVFIGESLARLVGRIHHRIQFPITASCVTVGKDVRVREDGDGDFRCGELDCRFNTEGEKGEVLVVRQAYSRYGWHSTGVCQGVEQQRPQVLHEEEAEETEDVG